MLINIWILMGVAGLLGALLLADRLKAGFARRKWERRLREANDDS